ncbi:MAG: hypothetical protein K6G68_11215 [Oscillospiraceae bacterium]|nr:hypothetical protein [Oscillospiraceae bacterium]
MIIAKVIHKIISWISKIYAKKLIEKYYNETRYIGSGKKKEDIRPVYAVHIGKSVKKNRYYFGLSPKNDNGKDGSVIKRDSQVREIDIKTGIITQRYFMDDDEFIVYKP